MRKGSGFVTAVCVSLAVVWSGAASGQEPAKPAERKPVQITFLPPPMENATYSLGLYDLKSGQLVRRLHDAATESAFTAGLNGLITSWDGKDDSGKPVPPGAYAARGYAVGPLTVEGVAFHGNDWVSADESLRVTHIEAIALVPEDNGLVALAATAGGGTELFRLSGESGTLLWRKRVAGISPSVSPWLSVSGEDVFIMPRPASGVSLPKSIAGQMPHGDSVAANSLGCYQLKDGSQANHSISVAEITMPVPPSILSRGVPIPPPQTAPSPAIRVPALSLASPAKDEEAPLALGWPVLPKGSGLTHVFPVRGKDGTTWEAAHAYGLVQRGKDSAVLRRLEVAPGDPEPQAVSASTREDILYLLEEKDGWQRVRGLSWVEASEENGHAVSTWKTFFERSIRTPEASTGLGDAAAAKGASPAVEINLAENPLLPGKPARARLAAAFDEKGSYLATADGLRLRKISERPDLRAVKLVKAGSAGRLTFYQTDGAAWDEFSIEGADQLMAVDGGEFELTATGEKPAPAKATEPSDL